MKYLSLIFGFAIMFSCGRKISPEDRVRISNKARESHLRLNDPLNSNISVEEKERLRQVIKLLDSVKAKDSATYQTLVNEVERREYVEQQATEYY